MRKLFAGFLAMAGILNAQTVQDMNSISVFSNEINAGSARYIGMGGAMGALGGDVSSISQNPAGAAVAITSSMDVSLAITDYKNKSKFGNSFTGKDNTTFINNFGGNLVFNLNSPKWTRFSVAVNFTEESLDNYLWLGRNDQISGTYQTGEDPDEFTHYSMAGYYDELSGYKSKVAFNFSASYEDWLYLGLGLNAHDVRQTNYVTFFEDTTGEDGDGAVYGYDLNGTPYSSRGSGFSFAFGAIAKTKDNLRFGAAYHTPVWYWNIDENFFADLQIGENFNYDLYYDQYDRNANGKLVGSVGAVLGKSLAVDLDMTAHFNGDNKLRPNRYFTDTNRFIKDNMKTSLELRAGAEYRYEKFRLRAGYNFVESPFKNLSLDSDFGNGTHNVEKVSKPFRGDINRFSVGAGYDFGGFYLDFAYQFQQQKYKYIFGNGVYVDYDYNEDAVYYAALPYYADYNYVADVKKNNNMFLISAGWQF